MNKASRREQLISLGVRLFATDSEADLRLLAGHMRRGGYDPTCERVETAAALRR